MNNFIRFLETDHQYGLMLGLTIMWIIFTCVTYIQKCTDSITEIKDGYSTSCDPDSLSTVVEKDNRRWLYCRCDDLASSSP